MSVTREAFEAWADRAGLSGKSREAVRLIEMEGMSINGAARARGIDPSTVSRAHARYKFPLCPCCGKAWEDLA